MLKSKRRIMKELVFAGVLAVGGMSALTNVHAGAPTDSTTPVTYENRSVNPDANGQYGMVVPIAVSFTDGKQTADASIEITGVNGYDLDKDWTKLDVSVKVASANGYKLKNGDKEAGYSIKMVNNAAIFTADTTSQEITKHFGVGDAGFVKKEEGTATLTVKATAKGKYIDTLTYTFTENANITK